MSLYSPRMMEVAPSSAYGSPPRVQLSTANSDANSMNQGQQFLYVLPVLLMEFLALALTRAVLPGILVQQYGSSHVYLVMGVAECVRGLLAFVACPLFGKLSDVVGRRLCLLVTVAGTCAPVCSLAIMSFTTMTATQQQLANSNNVTALPSEGQEDTWTFPMFSDNNDAALINDTLSSTAITLFVVLLALSGVFSSTFTLVFAYISDTVTERNDRVAAYGLALATFGLSFTIGPMAGGYIANAGKTRHVFAASFTLTLLDLVYIYFILPESNPQDQQDEKTFSWSSPFQSLALVSVDPFLRRVGKVAFFYYTALWAVISTLILYAAQRFRLGPERLGELMSALGLSTMIAEAVLVRILVPIFGELKSMQMGLISFVIQCIILGFAYEPWHLFVCAAFSLLGNLVYPSLSSLVSGNVEPKAVGEALGAINGIKALTEGIGPLVFGSLMTLSQHSALPGWPYLLAALLSYCAYHASKELPDLQDSEEYVHELELKPFKQQSQSDNGATLFWKQWMLPSPAMSSNEENRSRRNIRTTCSEDDDDEYQGLLSEIEESEDDEVLVNRAEAIAGTDNPLMHTGGFARPVTFASLMKKPPQA